MVETRDCRTLEERMFNLGTNCEPLPKEPEPINRTYYNLGLMIYSKTQDMRELKKIIDLGTNQIKQLSKQNQMYKEIVDETFIKITKIYINICEILCDESVPKISKSKVLDHTKHWVDLNYDLIKNLNLKKFNDKYESIVNNKYKDTN